MLQLFVFLSYCGFLILHSLEFYMLKADDLISIFAPVVHCYIFFTIFSICSAALLKSYCCDFLRVCVIAS